MFYREHLTLPLLVPVGGTASVTTEESRLRWQARRVVAAGTWPVTELGRRVAPLPSSLQPLGSAQFDVNFFHGAIAEHFAWTPRLGPRNVDVLVINVRTCHSAPSLASWHA
jgi:hypothetical protein